MEFTGAAGTDTISTVLPTHVLLEAVMGWDLDEKGQRPYDVYSLVGTGAGFDIEHWPKDDLPCEPDENGECHRLDHLMPVARISRRN